MCERVYVCLRIVCLLMNDNTHMLDRRIFVYVYYVDKADPRHKREIHIHIIILFVISSNSAFSETKSISNNWFEWPPHPASCWVCIHSISLYLPLFRHLFRSTILFVSHSIFTRMKQSLTFNKLKSRSSTVADTLIIRPRNDLGKRYKTNKVYNRMDGAFST